MARIFTWNVMKVMSPVKYRLNEYLMKDLTGLGNVIYRNGILDEGCTGPSPSVKTVALAGIFPVFVTAIV